MFIIHSLGFNKGVLCSCFLQGPVSSVGVSADKTFGRGCSLNEAQGALPAGPSSSSFRQGPFSGSSTALIRVVRTGSETAGLSELTCSHLWSARELQAQPLPEHSLALRSRRPLLLHCPAGHQDQQVIFSAPLPQHGAGGQDVRLVSLRES